MRSRSKDKELCKNNLQKKAGIITTDPQIDRLISPRKGTPPANQNQQQQQQQTVMQSHDNQNTANSSESSEPQSQKYYQPIGYPFVPSPDISRANKKMHSQNQLKKNPSSQKVTKNTLPSEITSSVLNNKPKEPLSSQCHAVSQPYSVANSANLSKEYYSVSSAQINLRDVVGHNSPNKNPQNVS